MGLRPKCPLEELIAIPWPLSWILKGGERDRKGGNREGKREGEGIIPSLNAM